MVRLRESWQVFPVLFQGPASPIRESVRPFRGIARASKFLLEGVSEAFSGGRDGRSVLVSGSP